MNSYGQEEVSKSNPTSSQKLYEFQMHSEELAKYYIEKEMAIINKA